MLSWLIPGFSCRQAEGCARYGAAGPNAGAGWAPRGGSAPESHGPSPPAWHRRAGPVPSQRRVAGPPGRSGQAGSCSLAVARGTLRWGEAWPVGLLFIGVFSSQRATHHLAVVRVGFRPREPWFHSAKLLSSGNSSSNAKDGLGWVSPNYGVQKEKAMGRLR